MSAIMDTYDALCLEQEKQQALISVLNHAVISSAINIPFEEYLAVMADQHAKVATASAALYELAPAATIYRDSMRQSYRQTVEAGEALLKALEPLEKLDMGEAFADAVLELEGNVGAARDDFLGHGEAQ